MLVTTCAATEEESNAWIATGGSTIARILATRDGGDTWKAYDTPLVSSPSAGGISVAFRDPWHGILGGGDLASNDAAETATSDDGGQTWTLTNKPPVEGAIFCLAYVRGNRHDDDEEFDQEHDHAVVITVETEPNFDSGAAAWTPDCQEFYGNLANSALCQVIHFAGVRRFWRGTGGDEGLVFVFCSWVRCGCSLWTHSCLENSLGSGFRQGSSTFHTLRPWASLVSATTSWIHPRRRSGGRSGIVFDRLGDR